MQVPDITFQKKAPELPRREHWKAALAKLEIGDAFFVVGNHKSPGAAIRVTAHRLGIVVEQRRIEGTDKIRVQRIKPNETMSSRLCKGTGENVG